MRSPAASRSLLEPAGVPLIVNNRLDVAVASGADGRTFGQADIAPARAREALGDEALLGLSITDPSQLAVIDAPLVDYLGVGPMFATATKPDAAPPMGEAGLAACGSQTDSCPSLRSAASTARNAAAVIRAGSGWHRRRLGHMRCHGSSRRRHGARWQRSSMRRERRRQGE